MGERARVLSCLSDALQWARTGNRAQDINRSWQLAAGARTWNQAQDINPGDLCLKGFEIREEGCRVLAAALQALPRPLHLQKLDLGDCGLTPTGMMHVSTALSRADLESLTDLRIGGNLQLADAGLACVFAMPLPWSTLARLDINATSIGDSGMGLLAAAMPTLTCLRVLGMAFNFQRDAGGVDGSDPSLPAAALSDEGWLALWETLPQARALATLDLTWCRLSGRVARALVALLPRCSMLRKLYVAIAFDPSDDRDREASEEAIVAAAGALPELKLSYNGCLAYGIESDEDDDDNDNESEDSDEQ